MTKSIQIAVRLDPATVDLADEVVELIGRTSPVKPQRTAVLRAAIERGLQHMRSELRGGKRRK